MDAELQALLSPTSSPWSLTVFFGVRPWSVAGPGPPVLSHGCFWDGRPSTGMDDQERFDLNERTRHKPGVPSWERIDMDRRLGS